MKIERPAEPVQATGRRESRTGAAPLAGVDAFADLDTILISEEARRRVEAMERGPAAMDAGERADLVAELKRRVLSGDYRPDLRRTALFLVDDADQSLV